MAEAFKESPNFSPSARLELGGALQHLIKYIFHNLEGMVAAKIVKYDRNTHVATVLPLVNIPYPDGNETKYAENEPFDVSVMMFCHGGFLFDMPLAEGDTGWVIAADRDTTLAKQNNASVKGSDNNGTQRPNSLMRHKYSQGFFIPDSWAKIPFDDEKFADKFVIGDIENVKDPSAYLTIDHDGNFLVHADNRIDLLSKLLHISGDVEADGSVEVKKDLNVGGNANVSGNLTVDGQQSRINDCTEQEVEIVQAEELPNQTVLKVYKTHVFHNGLRFVKNIVVKSEDGGSGEKEEEGGGGGSDGDTVIIAPFLCRRVSAGNSEIMFYLPDESAIIDGQLVDFDTNFNSVSGDWKKSNEADNTDTVWCWIGQGSNGSYVGHMANERIKEGTYTDEGELVICCFAVCFVTGVSDMSIFSGITQMSYGTLTLNTLHEYPFKIKYDSTNNEWIACLPDNAIVHMIEGGNNVGRIENFEKKPNKMQAAASGEQNWYVIYGSSGSFTGDVYCIMETQAEQSADYSTWKYYYLTTEQPSNTDSGFKVAKIRSQSSVLQYVIGAIVFNSTHDSTSGRNFYYADENSITGAFHDNRFSILGFGKYEIEGEAEPHGLFSPSSSMRIQEGVEDKGVAFLVRTPNQSGSTQNKVAYKTLKVGNPSCFMYEQRYTEQQGEQVVAHWITKNNFYWNGELKQIADFNVQNPAGATIYLNIVEDAETHEWTPSVAVQPAQGPEGKSFSYKLYEFDNQGKISCDYRTTFLALRSSSSVDVDEQSVDFALEDGESGEEPEKSDKLCVKGFANQDPDGTTLYGLMGVATKPYDPAQDNIHILCRNTGGARVGPASWLQYIPVGRPSNGNTLRVITAITGVAVTKQNNSMRISLSYQSRDIVIVGKGAQYAGTVSGQAPIYDETADIDVITGATYDPNNTHQLSLSRKKISVVKVKEDVVQPIIPFTATPLSAEN